MVQKRRLRGKRCFNQQRCLLCVRFVPSHREYCDEHAGCYHVVDQQRTEGDNLAEHAAIEGPYSSSVELMEIQSQSIREPTIQVFKKSDFKFKRFLPFTRANKLLVASLSPKVLFLYWLLQFILGIIRFEFQII